MTVKTMEDRKFLQALLLDTGSSEILDMLEGGNRGGFGSTLSALNAKIMGAAPVVIGIAAMLLYR
jgi:hypothetical protein